MMKILKKIVNPQPVLIEVNSVPAIFFSPVVKLTTNNFLEDIAKVVVDKQRPVCSKRRIRVHSLVWDKGCNGRWLGNSWNQDRKARIFKTSEISWLSQHSDEYQSKTWNLITLMMQMAGVIGRLREIGGWQEVGVYLGALTSHAFIGALIRSSMQLYSKTTTKVQAHCIKLPCYHFL